jgi:hypothetical protein
MDVFAAMLVEVPAEHADKFRPGGDDADRAVGAVLETTRLVRGAVPVKAVPVRGQAAVRINFPRPCRGSMRSSQRRARASSGRSCCRSGMLG